MKKILFLSLIVILSFTCYIQAEQDPGLKITLSSDYVVMNPERGINFTLTITNNSEKKVKFSVPKNIQDGFKVLSGPTTIKDINKSAELTTKELGPGEFFGYNVNFNQATFAKIEGEYSIIYMGKPGLSNSVNFRIKNLFAVIHTSMGDITISFLTDKAPNTVRAFIALANDGAYDQSTFHRLIAGFMMQGGMPHPDYVNKDKIKTLKAEFNDTPHLLGTVSMARRGNDNDSATTQFFICFNGNNRASLDGKYTAFGQVIEGLDIVKKAEYVLTERYLGKNSDRPVINIVIHSIRAYGSI